MRDTIKHRSAYSGLIGIFVDRPILNLILVLSGVLSISITGIGSFFDQGGRTSLIVHISQFCIGLGGAFALPFLWHSIAQGSLRQKGIAGLVGALAVVSFVLLPTIFGTNIGENINGGIGNRFIPSFNWFSLIILFIAFFYIIISTQLTSKYSKILMIGAGVLCGVLFAIIGGVSQINESLVVGAIPLAICAIAAGGMIAFLIGNFYEIEISQSLKPRHAAYMSAYKVTPFIIFIILLMTGLLFIVPVPIDTETASNVLAGSSLSTIQQKIMVTVLVGMFPAISMFMTLPGFLWFYATRSKQQQHRNQRQKEIYSFDPQESVDDNQVQELVAIKLWKNLRRFLPPPTAYALFFMMAILCVLTVLNPDLRANNQEFLFLLVILGSATLAFLSLRASLVIASVMIMVTMLGAALIAIIGPMGSNEMSAYEIILVHFLSAINCAFFAVYFRDISATTQYPKMVISQVMQKAIGPFFMITGFTLALIIMSGFCGLWGRAPTAAIVYFASSILILVLSPTVMTILSARYGKF